MGRRQAEVLTPLDYMLKVERTRAIRDVGMSLAQASVNEPLLHQAALILLGGAFKGAHAIVRQVEGPTGPGLPTADAVGLGLWTAAGVNAAGDAIKDVIAAIRGNGSGAVSVAYDVPESDGAYAAPALAAAGGNPFLSGSRS